MSVMGLRLDEGGVWYAVAGTCEGESALLGVGGKRSNRSRSQLSLPACSLAVDGAPILHVPSSHTRPCAVRFLSPASLFPS